MSQEDVEALRRALDASNRRDIESFLAMLDPEVEWHPGLAALLEGEATVYRPHAEVPRGRPEALGEARRVAVVADCRRTRPRRPDPDAAGVVDSAPRGGDPRLLVSQLVRTHWRHASFREAPPNAENPLREGLPERRLPESNRRKRLCRPNVGLVSPALSPAQARILGLSCPELRSDWCPIGARAYSRSLWWAIS
jgi:hypothetical protein